ncbi:hypothetical protein N8313_03585 [Gammaproteobacteria bacterium]|nr:hypothetical protein [Gammaproteobacteria bacterium]
MKVLIHINSPLTAIVTLCYINKIQDAKSNIYITFSRVKSLSEWFKHLDNITIVDSFANNDLFDDDNVLIVPHDYVDGGRYTKHIQKRNIKNVYYIEEGELSWLGSRHHHDRRRLFNIRICDIPLIGKFFDKLVYSRDLIYITLDKNCFNFASDEKKIVVKIDKKLFGSYQRYFNESAKILLTGTFTYKEDLSNFLSENKKLNKDHFYIKPHPVVLSNKKLSDDLFFFLEEMDLFDRVIDRKNVSLEIEALFSDIEIYGSASTLEMYERFFSYKFFKIG